jgi:hypothetical protein
MGLRSDIQSKVGGAFDGKLADAVASLSLEVISSTFDPATSKTVNTSITHITRGVIGKYLAVELTDTSIQPSDLKILILQNDLDVVPVPNDNYIIRNNERYKILRVSQDPASVTWTIQCRK